MGGRNRLHPPFLVRFRTLQRGFSKKGGRSEERPESREETPKEGIRRQVAAFASIWCAAQKAMGKSPEAQQKHVHVHYLHGCDILASHPSPSAPFGGSRRSIAITGSHAPREFSDEIRPDARPAEWADGEADRAAFRLVEVRQALVEIDIPTSLAAYEGLFLENRVRGACVRAHAAVDTEIGGSEVVATICHQRGVGQHAGQPKVRTESAVNHRPMLAQLSEPSLDRGRDQYECASHRPSIGKRVLPLPS